LEEDIPMTQLIQQSNLDKSPPGGRERAVKILAKSIYKELRQNGYDPKQIVALSSELISLVTSEMKEDDKARG
jgi:hypothetical protein